MKKLRSSTTPTTSPRKPRSPSKKNISMSLMNHKICAYLSGCTCKEGHKTILDCKETLSSQFKIKECYVKLTRLEEMTDDLVVRWLENCKQAEASELEENIEPEPMEAAFIESPKKFTSPCARDYTNHEVITEQSKAIESDSLLFMLVFFMMVFFHAGFFSCCFFPVIYIFI